ncbi:MAG: hypothetical protein K6G45_11570 [Lachnospiraceae bacterium]|nr:hypothetical protein [Lachnospiraceae bacterium]
MENNENMELENDLGFDLKDSLNAAFKKNDITVSEDLIAATMARINAIKAEETKVESAIEEVKKDEITAPAPVVDISGRRKKIGTFVKIAVPIAAALFIGILGINMIKNGFAVKESFTNSAAFKSDAPMTAADSVEYDSASKDTEDFSFFSDSFAGEAKAESNNTGDMAASAIAASDAVAADIDMTAADTDTSDEMSSEKNSDRSSSNSYGTQDNTATHEPEESTVPTIAPTFVPTLSTDLPEEDDDVDNNVATDGSDLDMGSVGLGKILSDTDRMYIAGLLSKENIAEEPDALYYFYIPEELSIRAFEIAGKYIADSGEGEEQERLINTMGYLVIGKDYFYFTGDENLSPETAGTLFRIDGTNDTADALAEEITELLEQEAD